MTADMTPDPFRRVFERELQQALLCLYNPAKLQQSPLAELLALDNQRLSAAALGRLLLDAIQAIKPAPEVPIGAFAWRLFHVLTYRYAEQSSQKEVATDLALSVRQLRRQEQAAVQVLADYLWARYQIDRKTRQAPAILVPVAEASVPANQTERERELAWVRNLFLTKPPIWRMSSKAFSRPSVPCWRPHAHRWTGQGCAVIRFSLSPAKPIHCGRLY